METFLSKSVLDSLSSMIIHGNSDNGQSAAEILVYLANSHPVHVASTLGPKTLQTLLKSMTFAAEEVKHALISVMHSATLTSTGRDALSDENNVTEITKLIQQGSKYALKKGEKICC